MLVDVAAHLSVGGVLGLVRAGRIVVDPVYRPQRGPWRLFDSRYVWQLSTHCLSSCLRPFSRCFG